MDQVDSYIRGVLEELVLITTPSNKLHLKIYIEGEYICTQKTIWFLMIMSPYNQIELFAFSAYFLKYPL